MRENYDLIIGLHMRRGDLKDQIIVKDLKIEVLFGNIIQGMW